MGAKNSGGGKANSKAQDSARAAYMKKHPGQYPDSVKRGAINAKKYAGFMAGPIPDAQYERGMLGGILAYLCGYSSINPVNMVKE